MMSVADFSSSVVPVLPDTGCPTMPLVSPAVAPPHLPYWDESPSGQRAASTTPRATSGSTTCLHSGSAPLILLPSLSRISTSGVGLQYLPSATSVANALAISSGNCAVTPSVNAPQVCAL